MGTSAALACFAFVLLAMNFATYFAEEEQTLDEETFKALCGNKSIEAMDPCFNEKASALTKELFPLCAKNVGIKGEFSMKSMVELFCVKGGAKIYNENCVVGKVAPKPK